ncbi:hypothetical protein ATCC90586_009301 [Pythium insidiosum]|nr:hypothetical protein ATCC90586_009301 [Pythium insidiosum]
MQAAVNTRLRCDPTDYARKQQEKKERAKELREQRQRGVFSDDHTFTPKVNPRAKGATPSSREEDERPAMQQPSGNSFDDIPIRPSKALLASRKEILSPEDGAAAVRKSSVAGNGRRPNNNRSDDGFGDHESDSLDTLSRKFPNRPAAREPEHLSPPRSTMEPQHDSLHREVKRATGRDLDDVPIKKPQSNAARAHTGPCLRNSSCGCPQCAGGGVSSRPEPPIRRREMRAEPADDPYAKPSAATGSRSARAAQSEIENSLTLLKSKMSRRKARSAPTNQAPLYLEKTEPSMHSARQSSESFGYASSSSSSSRRLAPEEPTASQRSNTRSSQPPADRSGGAAAGASRRSDAGDRMNASASRRLPRHQEEAEDEEDEPAAPPARRGSVPLPVATRPQAAADPNPEEYDDGDVEMRECANCNRRFNVVSLEKHQKICEKVFSGHRKVFDMTAKRLEGTEAEKYAKQGPKKGGAAAKRAAPEEQPIKAKAVDWKQQSNAFREAMRANREVTKAIKEGRPPPPMAPSAPDPSLIPCDFCGRRFNEKAAERHIPFCKEKSQRDNVSKGPGKKPGAAAASSGAAARSSAAAPPRAPPPRKR